MPNLFFRNKKTLIFFGFLVFLLFIPFCFSGIFSFNSAMASQCDDGIDNDNDFYIDFATTTGCAAPDCLGADLDCTDANDDTEGIDLVGNITSGLAGFIAGFLLDQLKGFLEGFLYIFNVLGSFIILVPAALLGVIVLISGIAMGVAIGLLSWYIGICLTIPIINSDIVQIGWAFSRDFVNMFFILILAFIGLATILRLEAYEVKKTFPLLVIMTLLVNFSLVFVGVIVDFSEIITAFFLNSLGGGVNWLATPLDQTINFYYGLGSAVFSSLTGGFGFSQMLFWACKGIVLIVFNVIAAVIFFVIAFIFILRVVMLWLLAIFAPFAFISYVFPSTRKAWDQWWNHLIQWSIIGIPILFTLYLATFINNSAGFDTLWKLYPDPVSPDGTSLAEKLIATASLFILFREGIATLISSLLQPMVSLIILGIGVLAAISFAPSGAKQIMSGAKKAGLWAANQRPVALKLGGAAGWSREKINESAEKLKDLGDRTGLLGKLATRPFYHATRAADLILGPELLKYEQKTKKMDLPPEFKAMGKEKQAEYILKYLTESEDRVRAAALMAENGDFQRTNDTFKEAVFKDIEKKTNDIAYKKEVGEILNAVPDKITKQIKLDYELVGLTGAERAAKEIELNNKLTNINNTIVNMASPGTQLRMEIDGKAAAKGLTADEYIDRHLTGTVFHLGSLKPADWTDVSKDSIKDPAKSLAQRLALKMKGTSEHIKTIRNSFDAETNKVVLEGTGGVCDLHSQAEYNQAKFQNPDLYSQIFTTPGLKDVAQKLRDNIPGLVI